MSPAASAASCAQKNLFGRRRHAGAGLERVQPGVDARPPSRGRRHECPRARLPTPRVSPIPTLNEVGPRQRRFLHQELAASILKSYWMHVIASECREEEQREKSRLYSSKEVGSRGASSRPLTPGRDRDALHVRTYEVRYLIWTLFKDRSLFYHTIDLICTTRFASLPHKSLL